MVEGERSSPLGHEVASGLIVSMHIIVNLLNYTTHDITMKTTTLLIK